MENFWRFIAESTKIYHEYRKKIMEKFDLSAVEVDVLLFLANNPQYNGASDITEFRKISKSHVSLAVKGLVAKNYLREQIDPENRRKINLTITDSAAVAIEFGQQEQKNFMDIILHGFSAAEIEEFFSYFNRTVDNIHFYFAGDVNGSN